LSLSAIHVHYLADYLGAGPRWPLYYLYPLSREAWLFKYQWNLGSWQEQLIALLSIIASIFIARKRRWTIVGLFSKKADNRVMEVIDRFPCRKVNR
ncbi:MAG: hypothetical protein HZA07_01810, partial [Nitrospirae bacterium]|nr:hypothetical protein [Nitrospirota bacterium]